MINILDLILIMKKADGIGLSIAGTSKTGIHMDSDSLPWMGNIPIHLMRYLSERHSPLSKPPLPSTLQDKMEGATARTVKDVSPHEFVQVAHFKRSGKVGYSSPKQSAIREDLNLSIAQYSLFGSLLAFGAMIGEITSGKIADFIGRKGAMRLASAVCAAGWLAIYFAKGNVALDIGRLATGYGKGVFFLCGTLLLVFLGPFYITF